MNPKRVRMLSAAAFVLLLSACTVEVKDAEPAAAPTAKSEAPAAAAGQKSSSADSGAGESKPAAAPKEEPAAPEAKPQSPKETPAAKPGSTDPQPAKEPVKEPAEAGSAGKPAVEGSAPKNGTAVLKNPAGAVVDGAAGSAAKPVQGSGDRKSLSWYYMKKPKGQVPGFPGDVQKYTPEMKALWVGTGKKVYLTIDTGGPLGDIDTLVESLRKNKAKANFFIAGYNVKKNPDFIRTLVADGHLVANHTMTHTDMNEQSDETVRQEIEDFEKLFKQVTGKEVEPYFRFPYGRYNMHLLKTVSDMGYTSVFWSTAMRDWEPRKNGAEDPYNDIRGNLHDGNIILMHQGSPENIEALDRIIKGVREAGYEFALLNDIQPPAKAASAK